LAFSRKLVCAGDEKIYEKKPDREVRSGFKQFCQMPSSMVAKRK